MDSTIEVIKAFSPVLQTLCGGLLAFLGVLVSQKRTFKGERNNLYRNKIQECYEFITEMEDCYINEQIVFFEAVNTRNIELVKKSKHYSNGDKFFNKANAIIELYLPELDDVFVALCVAETAMLDFHNSTIDSIETIDIEKCNKKSEKLSKKFSEAIADVKDSLSESMRNYTNF